MDRVFDHCVECDEELSHAGHLDDEVWFSGIFESFCEFDEDRVTSPGREGSHIECGTNLASSARNATSSFQFTAVMVVGCDTGKCGDLGSIYGTQFGDFGEELMGGHFTDSRYAAEDIAFCLPVFIGVKEVGDGIFDDDQLLVEQGNSLPNTLVRNFPLCGLLSVYFDGSEMKDLFSSCDEILQFLLAFGGFGSQPGSDDLSELGEVTGVNGIGLGPVAESFRKVSCLSRIDDGNGNIGIDEMTDERSLVASRGLDNEELQRRELLQVLDEFFITLQVIGECPLQRERTHMHVELVLGDIDPNEHGGWTRSDRDGVSPVLQIRTRSGFSRSTVHAAVRAFTGGDAAILLCDGVLSTKARSIYRTPGSQRLFASAQRRWLPGVHYTAFTSF